MLNDVHMGGVVGDEIVALPSDHGYIAAHPGAIAAFDFIGAFSALPTPMETDMTEHIHIPPEAVEAGARAIGEETYVGNKQTLRDAATAAIRAALENWPGMHTHEWQRPWLGGMSGTDIILPLNTESKDD